jgi:ComEC/Rec2-related protein
MFDMTEKLREQVYKLNSKYPFIVPFLSAIIGIEIWKISEDFIISLTAIMIISSLVFLITKKFEISITLFITSFLFLISSMEKDRAGKFIVGKIINLTPNSFIIQAEYVKKDFDSDWEKSASYIRIQRSVIKEKEEFDVFDRTLLGCKKVKKLKTGWYLCKGVIFFRKIENKGIEKFLSKIRKKSQEILITGKEKTDEWYILEATIFGTNENENEKVILDFSKLGVVHVIAISGSHFATIALVGYFIGQAVSWLILRYTKFVIQPYIIKAFFSLILQIFFLFISGMTKPAVRAFIMSSIFSLSLLAKKPYSLLNSLFASGFFILLFNPFDLWDLSFLLSFSSVLFLIVFTPKVKGKFNLLFVTSLIASLGTLPISISTGLPISLISPIANFIFVPIFSVVITLGVFGLISGFLFEPIGFFLFYLSSLLVKISSILAEIFSPVAEHFVFYPKINFPPELAIPLIFLFFLSIKRTKFFYAILSLFFVSLPITFHYLSKERKYTIGHIVVKEIKTEEGKKEIYFIPLRENLKAKDIIQKTINRKRKYIRCITICDTSKFKDINMEEIEEKVNLCKEDNKEDERCTF